MLQVGSIILTILFIPMLTIMILNALNPNNEKIHMAIVSVLGILEIVVFNASVSALWLIYAIETVSERGFTLIMVWHWITMIINEPLISLIINIYGIEFTHFVWTFLIFYLITSILVFLPNRI